MNDTLPSAPPSVHNGTYTVEAPDGRHFTIKLATQQRGNLAGKRVLYLLTGPDNTSSYTGVAFWNDLERVAHVWKRHRSASAQKGFPYDGGHWDRDWSKIEKKVATFVDLAARGDASHWRSNGYVLHVEGRCVRCNRKLTDPESIRLGIGPECGGRR